MRLCVIGCGRIAQAAHVPAIDQVPDAQVVGVMDASPQLAEALGGHFGVPGFTNLLRLIRDTRPEGAILAVPDRLHHELSILCLQHDIDVLVEKPLASTVAEALEVEVVVNETGRYLQVGNMKRHDPGLVHARESLKDLGDVLSFTAWYRAPNRRHDIPTLFPPMTTDEVVIARESELKADRISYQLRTHGSHLWDTVRFVLQDDFAELSAVRANVTTDVSWQVLIRMRSGAVGTTDLTVNVHGDASEGMIIHCARGSVRVDTFLPFERRVSQVEVFSDTTDVTTTLPRGYSNHFEMQLREFIAVSTANRTKEHQANDVRSASVADGVAAIRVIEAVESSVETGGKVNLA